MDCSIVIAEAHCLVREALRALLESQPGIRVTGDTHDGQEFTELCLSRKPDVAIVDAQLPSLAGLDAVRMLRSRSARPCLIVMSACNSPSLARLALLAGASAFVSKHSPANDLFAAVHASHQGRACLPETLRGASGGAGPVNETEGETLTMRQAEVLRLVAEGRSTREIAAVLGVSTKTAQTHRIRLMRKVGAHKASELTRYAIREGFLEA